MAIIAFEGPAGTGKTWSLMAALEKAVAARPLLDGQKVLALTFMHGSRRRLHERLTSMVPLGGRFECSTFDNLAWRLCHRWRQFAIEKGREFDPAGEYEGTCAHAGWLLGHREVRSWLRAAFPFVLVDEAQDLTVPRLSMVQALALDGDLLLAADEFQCLQTDLHDNPTIRWLQESVKVEGLTKVKRTDVPGLLEAATALRRSSSLLLSGRGFKLVEASAPELMAWHVSSALDRARKQRESVAVITPSRSGGMVDAVLERVRAGPIGRDWKVGPFPIRWEMTAEGAVQTVIGGVALPDVGSHLQIAEALTPLKEHPAVAMTLDWLARRGALGVGTAIAAEDVRKQVSANSAALSRLRSAKGTSRPLAMTVQQAKNREFDGVIVLWPHNVPQHEEHQRRMLYNAVTRARKWCVVVVLVNKKKDRLIEPPFEVDPSELAKVRAAAAERARQAKGRLKRRRT